jgi:phage portal protein BeeE
MTWSQMSCSPEDAQLLESLRFTVEAICRLLGVPPQLIGDTSKVAYSNMVEAARHLARFCIMLGLQVGADARTLALDRAIPIQSTSA